jgi:hypothetical protein
MYYSVHVPGTPTITRDDCEYTKQNVIAFHDRIRVVSGRDGFFGGSESRPYKSRILVNPTWRDLLRVAKSQQKKTKDYHHSFLEGASIVRREVDKDGVSYGVVHLQLGS